MLTRRDFTLWLGTGLAGLSDPWRLSTIARQAAEALGRAGEAIGPARTLEHWRVAENNTWRWLERSQLRDGVWVLTGITHPRRREHGYLVDGRDCADFLLESEAPEPLREAMDDDPSAGRMTDFCLVRQGATPGPMPMPARKAREGRPPSRWVRDLDRRQLAAWLSVFDPPRADVSGMSFLEHLTRDHGFREEQVVWLSEEHLAKLHGAAHSGY